MSDESFKKQQEECWGQRDEDYFLEHCFFVNGNGLRWINSERIKNEKEEWKKRLKELLGEEKLNNLSAKNDCKNDCAPHKIYPICQYAKINHLPDDIEPSWLEAAKRAIEFARSNRAIITTEDSEWLDKAELRIAELEEGK